jgi:hypothetical protein
LSKETISVSEGSGAADGLMIDSSFILLHCLSLTNLGSNFENQNLV